MTPPLLLAFVAGGFLCAAGLAAMPGPAGFQPSAERPAGWRGDGSGQYPAATPVSKWSGKENVLWKTEAGAGHSSPVIAGGRVFVTSEPDQLVCLDLVTGKELWRRPHKLADLPGAPDAKGRDRSSQYGDATPTPVSDGQSVWVFTGTGIVSCHDLDGNRRWMNGYDLRQNTSYGRTASPVLVGGRLLVHFGPLACLDASTGKVLWTNVTAKASYGTPAPARIGDVDVVITPKGQVVRVADGKTLATDLGNCMYTSPVIQSNVVFFIDGAMTAVQLPSKAADNIECKELWAGDLPGEFFASPVVYGGHVYTVDKKANYHVLDALTGKTLLSAKLGLSAPGRAENACVYPSPVLAGRHLLVGNDAGESLLLEPGIEGAAAGSNSLPAGSGATPVFSGSRMLVRAGTFLYCVGAPRP